MRIALPLLSRAALLVMGLGALYWVVSFAPLFRVEAPLNVMASNILAGEKVAEASLQALRPRIDVLERAPRCFASGLRSGVIMELRLIQNAVEASDGARLDELLPSADSLIRKSLACSPVSSYSWLALFWVENLRRGFSERSIQYLEMSYLTGPREGWISVKRNAYAFALFDSLPQPLQIKIRREFVDLVDAGFVTDAAAILAGPAWRYREQVMDSLSSVRAPMKRSLAILLRRKGLDLSVPGVELPDLRPWSR